MQHQLFLLFSNVIFKQTAIILVKVILVTFSDNLSLEVIFQLTYKGICFLAVLEPAYNSAHYFIK